DAAHDAAHDLRFVLAIDARDAEADRRRHDCAIADGRLHHLMEHLFDGELAGGVQVRAGTVAFSVDHATLVRQQADRFRAAGIDAQDVHAWILSRRPFPARIRGPAAGSMLRSGGFMPHAVPRTAAAAIAARRIPVKWPVDAQEETHALAVVRTALMSPSARLPDP